MPGLTGIEVIEALRGWTQVPILVVSGRTDSGDKVEALDAGADDYVTKPFAADELLARIRALTRRTPAPSDEPVVRFGDVTVDLAAHRSTTDATRDRPAIVRLTPDRVAAARGAACATRDGSSPAQTLLTEVWGPQYTTDTGYLRLYLVAAAQEARAGAVAPALPADRGGHGLPLRARRDPEQPEGARADRLGRIRRRANWQDRRPRRRVNGSADTPGSVPGACATPLDGHLSRDYVAAAL